MSSNKAERPEWIQPGAEVVRWSTSSNRAQIVKIKSVGKVWITLETNDPRINIESLRSTRQGSTWNSWRVYIAERNSPEAIKRLNRSYVSECAERAQRSQTAWDADQLNQRKIAAVVKSMSDLNDAIELMKENS